MNHIKQVSFRLPAELIAAMENIKTIDGMPVSEQIRRALKVWIEERKNPQPHPARRAARR